MTGTNLNLRMHLFMKGLIELLQNYALPPQNIHTYLMLQYIYIYYICVYNKFTFNYEIFCFHVDSDLHNKQQHTEMKRLEILICEKKRK